MKHHSNIYFFFLLSKTINFSLPFGMSTKEKYIHKKKTAYLLLVLVVLFLFFSKRLVKSLCCTRKKRPLYFFCFWSATFCVFLFFFSISFHFSAFLFDLSSLYLFPSVRAFSSPATSFLALGGLRKRGTVGAIHQLSRPLFSW